MCQAAGIGYTFTYELNRIRNTSAQVAQNQYAPFYTYNYLWEVFGDGSWTTDGWQIAKENGCASVETWGGMHVDMQKWMSGYSNYKNSMNNTLDKYEKINVRYDYQGYTPLTRMKHWLNDHNEGSATGGLIVIYAWLGNAYYATPVGGNDNVPIMLGLSTPAAGFFML
ncbi:MAG: hypothetical protein P9L91_02565 [Candidatus Zophobacter franzmannii]|nr:hypothetical protein [Candidatus Zophobacter franzmannii]